MPLLDIEKQLFVCKNQKRTIQITVKNAGTDLLELRDVFPIGKDRDYIHINFNNQAIKPNDTTDIEVTIDDYWKPIDIQVDTNCPQTGKIISVLRPEDPQGPNLWLFPDEKYNRDQVFFHDPEPHLWLPIIVQSDSDNPLEIDFSSIKLTDENGNKNSATSHKIDVYCGETGRKVSLRRKKQCYQILNTQEENYQVHFVNIHFPKTMIEDGSVVQAIQLDICTNSYLREFREQKISIQLTKLEITPIVKGNRRLRWWEKKQILEIKNSGPHPLRIFNIPTDLDKIEVEYPETDNRTTEVSYPIVIQKNESEKLGITIKSSFKDWLWSGIDLSNVSIPIYANTVSAPQSYKVSSCETKIQSAWIFWIPFVALGILVGIGLFLFFRQPEQDVVISSYPYGQTVRVDGEKVGTTPTLLKVKEKAIIQIGDSRECSVKEVLEDGLIFYREEKKESQNEQ